MPEPRGPLSLLDEIRESVARVPRDAIDSPEAALVTIRRTCEQICRWLALAHGCPAFNHNETLGPMLRRLWEDERCGLPKLIAVCFGTAQHFGNLGAHDDPSRNMRLTTQDAAPAFVAFESVIRWFSKTYLGQQGIVFENPLSTSTSGTRHYISKLPKPDYRLFGRDTELALIEKWWVDPDATVGTIVAVGGGGKSALVNHWLQNLRDEQWAGAEKVFGWSFFSQGSAANKQASSDLFFTQAFHFFNLPDPGPISGWEKGRLLAETVRNQQILLILDGLEPLQYPPGAMEGELRDLGIKSLLIELATENCGLCLITTRIALKDLDGFHERHVPQLLLSALSPESGAIFLRDLGVTGSDIEVRQAVVDFGGHALALRLLGGYLVETNGGSIMARCEIPALSDQGDVGGHAKRVMQSYERWLDQKPEIDLLFILGLFDRPVEFEAIQTLLMEGTLPHISEKLVNFSKADWKRLFRRLHRVGLLFDGDQELVDCHPLVREYFGCQLKLLFPEVWQTAHYRLFQYYCSSAPPFPESLLTMQPLFFAVYHGCQSGHPTEAFVEVLWNRIYRRDRYYADVVLGAYSATFTALASFFTPPWERVVNGVSPVIRGLLLKDVGYLLYASGRLAEARDTLKGSVEISRRETECRNALSRRAHLYAEVLMARGELNDAYAAASEALAAAKATDSSWDIVASLVLVGAIEWRIGKETEAGRHFEEAEKLQQERQPNYYTSSEYPASAIAGATPPFEDSCGRLDERSERHFEYLYAIRGFYYCEWLLQVGRVDEVTMRASHTLNQGREHYSSEMRALDNLSLGIAADMQARAKRHQGFDENATVWDATSERHLAAALDLLEVSGLRLQLPRVLVARASYNRVRGRYRQAETDLIRAIQIGDSNKLNLALLSSYLELAWLYNDIGQREEVIKYIRTVCDLMERTGYRACNVDIEALKSRAGMP